MNFLLLLFVFIASLQGEPIDELPEPYSSIECVFPFDSGGWYANADRIEQLIKAGNVKTVVEVGCWLGLSTRHMATLLPPNGKVYAVDHWKGSVEHQVGASFHSPVLFRLYEQFLSNVIHANLTDKIVPIRMDSLEAAKMYAEMSLPLPDLIYIDASHDYDSVYADIQAWYPFVQGHGIICGDDWHHFPIVKAVHTFAKEHRLRIEVGNNCWSLHELQ